MGEILGLHDLRFVHPVDLQPGDVIVTSLREIEEAAAQLDHALLRAHAACVELRADHVECVAWRDALAQQTLSARRTILVKRPVR
jgi:hypothetical protein